ncbi:MAG TPA: carboxypeptidase-like regulatory domain-containing protein [Nocardioidaceae bacterium]|nr:carboxypeptidase-like regulatory domain-containing protein [Nocardioidaceae bacterium]
MRSRPVLASVAATVPAVVLAGVPEIGVANTDPDERRWAAAVLRVDKAPLRPWIALQKPNVGIVTPGVLRVGSKLHIVWSRYDGSNRSVRTRVLNSSGRIASPTKPIVTGWLALIGDPKLLSDGNKIRAVFAGIRSTAPGDPYVGPAVSSTSAKGLAWDLQPGSLSATTAAGNAETIDAIDGAGAPFFAMGGFDQHVIMHRGTSPASPASTPDFFTDNTGCCPATSVALANDRGSGQVWAAWHALSASTQATAGQFVQRVWPRPGGAKIKAPGSSTGGHAMNPSQRVALSERAGGSVWLAYPLGYPTSKKFRMWKVGTKTFWDVRAHGQLGDVALAPGPAGRLWVAWTTLGDRKLHVARTNPAVTRLGAARKLPYPGGGQLNRFVLEGSRGPVDVVAAAQPPGSGSNGIYAGHVLPGLSVKASPNRLAQGRVTVTVTDAGKAVRGAKVAFRGHHATTNVQGKARFAVPPSVPDGRYAVAVSKPGYAKSAGRVTIT